MPSAGSMTGGGAARSPAIAMATRARRLRLQRDRQGLDSGQTPATTVAAAPATMTPAVGTADANDGTVEFSSGDGDPGNMQGTGVVREAIQALTRQVAGTEAGIKTPAQTAQTTEVLPQAQPAGGPTGTLVEAETAATLTALQSQQQDGQDLQRRSPRASKRSCIGCGTVVTTKWTPLGAGFVCDTCITALPQERQRRPLTAAEMAQEVQHQQMKALPPN